MSNNEGYKWKRWEVLTALIAVILTFVIGALNLLKSVTGVNAGIHRRRLRAGWDHDFLLRVLAASPRGK